MWKAKVYKLKSEKVELASKWVQEWEKASDKATAPLQGVMNDISNAIQKIEKSISLEGDVAKVMKPYIDAANELGEPSIASKIDNQLRSNLENARQMQKAVQALKEAKRML